MLGTCANDFEVFRELSRLLDPSAAIVESVSRRFCLYGAAETFRPFLFGIFAENRRRRFPQPVALYRSCCLCFVASFTV